MYSANEKRYEKAEFNKCGESGLYLPKISLGLWQNFGDNADYDEMKDIILTAFDMGVTHFDLANNYGPKPGAAEVNFATPAITTTGTTTLTAMTTALLSSFSTLPSVFGPSGLTGVVFCSMFTSKSTL